MAGHLAAFTAAVLLLVVAAQGQGVPSSSECQSRVNSIGQTGLLSQLSSCQGGPTPQCCSQAQGLVGFPGSGQLAGCLCNADVLEATLAGIESNQLARSAGVTRASVQTVFDSCNIPTASRSGSCPSGTSVSVTAPGTQVNVGGSPAPSSPSSPAVSVQAPGTNVQVGGGAPAPASSSSAPAPAPAPAAASGKFGSMMGKHHPFLSHWMASRSAPAPAPAPAPAMQHGHGFHKWGRKLFQVGVTAPGTNVDVSGANMAGTDVGVTAPGTTVTVGGSPAPAGDDKEGDGQSSPAPAAPVVPTPPSSSATAQAASAAVAAPAPAAAAPAAAHGKMAAAHQGLMQHMQSKMAALAAAHQAAKQHVANTVAQVSQAHQAKAAAAAAAASQVHGAHQSKLSAYHQAGK